MEVNVGSRKVLHELPGFVVLYENGYIERFPSPLLPASSEFIDGVATKDVSINTRKGTWVRIFLPLTVAHRSPTSSSVPLVLHFHGGAMCVGSPDLPSFHNFCRRMASASNSIWISVSYRLSPEHRLPAQYQDCFEALCWLRSQFATTKHPPDLSSISTFGQKDPWEPEGQDYTSGQKDPWEPEGQDFASGEKEPWVVDHGDASRVFCAGESAGATILHFVALKMVKHEWSPLNIRGLIFVDLAVMTDPLPQMTPLHDTTITTEALATCIALSLPEGAKLGDAVLDCLHPDSTCQFNLQWPPILLFAAEKDLLWEGVLRYYKSLKEAGKDVELQDDRGRGHCFHLVEADSEAARLRENIMVEFMRKLSV